MARKILLMYYSEKKKYFDRLIKAFDGQHREWQICFDPNRNNYIQPFFVESGQTIVEKANFNPLNKFEVAFSVQRFETSDCSQMFDWDFIIDIDKCELETRRKIYQNKIKPLLDSFDLIYLVDGRVHIWFPPWLHSCVPNWTALYDRDFAHYIKYFIEVLSGIRGEAEIDAGMFYWHRHKIRCPYTFHIESGKLQIFYDKNWGPLKWNEFLSLWTGNCFTLQEIEKYCLNFKRFLDYAFESGKILYEGFNFDKLRIELPTSIRKKKNREIRPCFKAAINNIFADKNMTHMPHKMRMALVNEAVCCGITDLSEIAKLFSKQKDYDFKKSLYQVKKLLENKKFIKPYREETIKKEGWCLGEKCKFFKP